MKPVAFWSLRTKLWLSLGLLCFILFVGSAISAVVLTRFSRELQRLLRENYDSEVYCEQMIAALDRLDAWARQQAWGEAGDVVDVDFYERQFDRNLAEQIRNISLPGESAETQLLAADWRQYARQLLELPACSAAEKQRRYVQSLAPGYRKTRAAAQRIAALNMSNVVSADGRVRANMIEVRDALLILVTVGAALAVAVFGAAGATVLRPLGELTRSARQVGAGELDLTVPVRSGDEVGQLAEAFNLMAQRLREYRKLDHDRLLRAQRTTQLAIDSLNDAVMVLSPSGQIEISNRVARVHFAAEPGRRLADLKLAALATLHEQIAAGRELPDPRGYETAIQLFDEGRERFLLPRGVPMYDAPEHLVGIALILVDVTHLRQADEFKSGLVSTVSHELRTPLTSIRMSTMLLADESLGPLTARQQKLVAAARDETERLYRIIESLLAFSRAQAAARRLPARAVAVQRVISEALDSLAAGFAEKQIQVETDADDVPNLLADANCAVSILSNLLSNALKFTPPGGRVKIIAHAKEKQVMVSVHDSGPGIPAAYAERVFERFFRVPGHEALPGSGLGLAIARQIAEAQGGSLTYAPGAGGGSVFQFTLPAV